MSTNRASVINNDSEYYTPKELAVKLNVSINTMRRQLRGIAGCLVLRNPVETGKRAVTKLRIKKVDWEEHLRKISIKKVA
jgi:hypothetical protein